MLSMTAFATLAKSQDGVHWVWELRSVNNRFLDIQLRLPDVFKPQESVYRELIRQRVNRGKVEVSLRIESVAKDAVPRLNTEKLFQFAALINEVRVALPQVSPVDPLAILTIPNMILQDSGHDQAVDEAMIQSSLLEALALFVEQKGREGAALQAVLQQRSEAALAQVMHLREQLESLMAQHVSQLKQRVQMIAPDLDESRWIQEVAMIAQRVDIAEEIERLRIHLLDTRVLLTAKEPVGRKLDFLMQELNREANTLGAKSMALEVTQASLALKVWIEQMREQVQNVE